MSLSVGIQVLIVEHIQKRKVILILNYFCTCYIIQKSLYYLLFGKLIKNVSIRQKLTFFSM